MVSGAFFVVTVAFTSVRVAVKHFAKYTNNGDTMDKDSELSSYLFMGFLLFLALIL